MKLLRTLTVLTTLCSAVWAQSYSFQPLEIPGSAEAWTYGVNNNSVAVGATYDEDFNSLGFIWQDNDFEFPELSLIDPEFIGINDQGAVVGLALDLDFFFVSFLLEGDELSFVQFPGADATFVERINNSGEIIGSALFDEDELIVPFYRDSTGEFEIIELADLPNLVISDINNSGVMVGSAYDEDGVPTGLILDGDQVEFVNHPDGPSELLAINDQGVVAGYLGDGRSYVFDGTEYIDVVFPGASDTTVWSINSQGMIGGEYMLAGEDVYRAFVAFPIPEPQSNSLLLLGVTFAYCILRRQSRRV